nr:MAG TPA: hypothetical protein [Caudoviricetes sp.]
MSSTASNDINITVMPTGDFLSGRHYFFALFSSKQSEIFQ